MFSCIMTNVYIYKYKKVRDRNKEFYKVIKKTNVTVCLKSLKDVRTTGQVRKTLYDFSITLRILHVYSLGVMHVVYDVYKCARI